LNGFYFKGLISLTNYHMKNVNSYPLLYYSKTCKRKNTNTALVIISRELCSGLPIAIGTGRVKVIIKIGNGNNLMK
jgi:hypothetical protein